MRLVHAFDEVSDLPEAEFQRLLGGKGAALVRLVRAGIPVPPGFTLTTDAFHHFRSHGWDERLDATLRRSLAGLEQTSGKRLGDRQEPLLVSVRSGAPVSMPGMMDTVLNVGMTPEVETALARLTGDPVFAADTTRRAASSFTEVVGVPAPADPRAQVRDAVRAVFESWDAPRARTYREVEDIDEALGTAATVQAMVFGNLGDRSGTGVAFSRDPSTGAPGVMGDFLPGAQGEDVVAGGHATLPLSAMADDWPEQHRQVVEIAERLEREFGDMVDLEFTVEDGTLWMLQARRGKRSPIATYRIAIDMAEDPAVEFDRADAVRACQPLLDDPPTVGTEPGAGSTAEIVKGLAASPGLGTGVLCVDPDDAVDRASAGERVVLARTATSPADVHGMAVAAGLFTTRGGLVSHAAVVARDWGIPAVVGATEASVDAGGVRGPGGVVPTGAVVTVDGDRGVLLVGASEAHRVPAPEVEVIRRWAAELLEAERRRPEGEAAGSSPAGADDPVGMLLHALAVKGMASVDALAAMRGRGPDVIDAGLQQLSARGLVQYFDGPGLWRLTPDGRVAHASWLEDTRAILDLDALPYDDFLGINLELKAICTEWQLRDGEPNDHADPVHDGAVLDRLDRLHEQIVSILPAMVAVLPWLDTVAPRLTAARDRLRDGDGAALTGVLCDSYHDVWMELHESLLLVQGIDRADEGSS